MVGKIDLSILNFDHFSYRKAQYYDLYRLMLFLRAIKYHHELSLCFKNAFMFKISNFSKGLFMQLNNFLPLVFRSISRKIKIVQIFSHWQQTKTHSCIIGFFISFAGTKHTSVLKVHNKRLTAIFSNSIEMNHLLIDYRRGFLISVELNNWLTCLNYGLDFLKDIFYLWFFSNS